ncbi:MAG: alpha/beta hydrolase family esterase [Bacillota bacterium]
MKKIKILTMIFVLLILSSCSKEHYIPYIDAVDEVFTIEYEGLEREYYVYIPSEVKEGSPLLLMLHGYGATIEYFVERTNMKSLADQDKVILVYPEGTPALGLNHWNANLEYEDIDDVGFLTTLVDHLIEEYHVNEDLVFVGGHSNGGFMTYTLACEANDTFKAYMSVSGLMSGETWETCEIEAETNLFQFHGTDDNIVPIDGTMPTTFGWGGAPPLEEMLNPWINVLEDYTLIEKSLNEDVMIKKYTSSNNNIVKYIKAEGYGHIWAQDGDLLDDEDEYSDMSQLLWSYMMTFIE